MKNLEKNTETVNLGKGQSASIRAKKRDNPRENGMSPLSESRKARKTSQVAVGKKSPKARRAGKTGIFHAR